MAQIRKKNIRKLESADLEKMSLPNLRKLAKKTATEYYRSGLSGISFGEHEIEKAAEALANQGNRTSLKKDIRSMKNVWKWGKQQIRLLRLPTKK